MNAKSRLVTDAGLAALKGLASDSPKLFLEADATALERRMKERAGTENIWGPPLDLREDLSAMNRLDRLGPETDAAFAPLVRAALGDLPPAEGLNEHRWATLNCFIIPKYVVTRWQSSNIANDPSRQANFVQLHWLRGARSPRDRITRRLGSGGWASYLNGPPRLPRSMTPMRCWTRWRTTSTCITSYSLGQC